MFSSHRVSRVRVFHQYLEVESVSRSILASRFAECVVKWTELYPVVEKLLSPYVGTLKDTKEQDVRGKSSAIDVSGMFLRFRLIDYKTYGRPLTLSMACCHSECDICFKFKKSKRAIQTATTSWRIFERFTRKKHKVIRDKHLDLTT